MIGLGVASFSHVGGTHFQNRHDFDPYMASITEGQLPIFRALTPTDEERMIRELILQMKLGRVHRPYFQQKFGVDVGQRFAGQIGNLTEHGFAAWIAESVRLSRAGIAASGQTAARILSAAASRGEVRLSAYDAIVIGGGPAGSTAACVLAMKGRKVVVLEKEKFPRYHIGESLLPFGFFTLERIGMLEKMKASHFVKKYSVQFVSPDGRQSQPFYFHTHLEHEAAQTWQVLRSELDQMLLDNAREKGAEVIEEITVRDTIRENGAVKGVIADRQRRRQCTNFTRPSPSTQAGEMRFSRRAAVGRFATPYLNKIAVWTYYKGAKRDPGVDEGATTVAYVPEKGWFWYIPLAGDIVSVGVVAEKDYLMRTRPKT